MHVNYSICVHTNGPFENEGRESGERKEKETRNKANLSKSFGFWISWENRQNSRPRKDLGHVPCMRMECGCQAPTCTSHFSLYFFSFLKLLRRTYISWIHWSAINVMKLSFISGFQSANIVQSYAAQMAKWVAGVDASTYSFNLLEFIYFGSSIIYFDPISSPTHSGAFGSIVLFTNNRSMYFRCIDSCRMIWFTDNPII